jgi:hypothetical protein
MDAFRQQRLVARVQQVVRDVCEPRLARFQRFDDLETL